MRTYKDSLNEIRRPVGLHCLNRALQTNYRLLYLILIGQSVRTDVEHIHVRNNDDVVVVVGCCSWR